ncbi:MAG: CHAT domain-containing protein [Blastocatellia bacterium]|nr:CHAT domain-containing protein [Blastocatellia bacterium]
MIKILFLAANPTKTNPRKLDEEFRAIDEKLQLSNYRDKFKIEQHWAVRVADLHSLLLRHQPDIVHFSGHGSEVGELVFQNESGSRQIPPIKAISNMFSILKDNIKCVVLNSCYSESQAKAIAEHIECVIGMSKAITDDSAINFAASFYEGLGYGRTVEEAFKLGCNQIDLRNLKEEDIPKLLNLSSSAAKLRFVRNSLMEGSKMSNVNSRLGLMRRLNGLTEQEFNQLLFIIEPPKGVVPPPTAPLGDRTFALLSWAESTSGCGLAKIERALEDITSPQ